MRSFTFLTAAAYLSLLPSTASASAAARAGAQVGTNSFGGGGWGCSSFQAKCGGRNGDCCSRSGLECDTKKNSVCLKQAGQDCSSDNHCATPNKCTNRKCKAPTSGGGGGVLHPVNVGSTVPISMKSAGTEIILGSVARPVTLVTAGSWNSASARRIRTPPAIKTPTVSPTVINALTRYAKYHRLLQPVAEPDRHVVLPAALAHHQPMFAQAITSV